MRVIKEIPYRECKVTLFGWNNRYIIKVEQGPFEQTFKIPELDLDSEDDLVRMIDEQFLQQALTRFREMASSLAQAQQRIG